MFNKYFVVHYGTETWNKGIPLRKQLDALFNAAFGKLNNPLFS